MKKKRIIWNGVAVALILTSLMLLQATESQTLPTVICHGCQRASDQTTKSKTFWVNENNDFNLEWSGPSGNYRWEINGKETGKGKLLYLTARKDAEYVFASIDRNGQKQELFRATVRIILPEVCRPSFDSEIIINDKEYSSSDTKKVAVGEWFNLEVEIDENDCHNYKIEWTSDPDGVIEFNNHYSRKTTAIVRKGLTWNPKIEVTLSASDGSLSIIKDTHLSISGNTPPAIKIRYDAYSHKSFDVYFDKTTTGTYGNEDNDYLARIEAKLYDSRGNFIDSDFDEFDEGDNLEPLTLTPQAAGEYTLFTRVVDSHGASAEFEQAILVQKGDTGKDEPVIYAPDSVGCITGQICRIDASETIVRDNSVKLEFYEDGIPLSNDKYGGSCNSAICPHIFSEGNHKVRLDAYYLDEDGDRYNEVSKTIFVNAHKQTTDSSKAKKSPLDSSTTALALLGAILFGAKTRKKPKN